MNQRAPTTREIAAACGCNQSTVSHALRGNPKISEETRRRVLEAARRLGWRPNPLASAYMAHLRSTRPPAYQASLGFLVSNRNSNQISALPVYQQRHFIGARERAEELGYAVEPVWLMEPGLTAKRLGGVLRSRGIVGLIIPGLLTPTDIFQDFEWRYFAGVAMGFSLRSPELNRVAVNTAHGFDAALRRAIELGYKRIAVAISEAYDERVNHGVYYPVHYMRHRHGATHEIELYSFPAPQESEVAGIRRWLEKTKPEVILGEDLVWHTVRRMGWRVPQDVGFISVDWSPEYSEIGGFNQRHETHGSVAVDLVVAQLLKNERGLPSIPRWVLVKGEWTDGASVPPAAERASARTAVNF